MSSPVKEITHSLDRAHQQSQEIAIKLSEPPPIGASPSLKDENRDRYYGVLGENLHFKKDRNLIDEEVTKLTTRLQYLQEMLRKDRGNKGGTPARPGPRMDRDMHRYLSDIEAENIKLRTEVKSLSTALRGAQMKPTKKTVKKLVQYPTKQPKSSAGITMKPAPKPQDNLKDQLIESLKKKVVEQEKYIKTMGQTGSPAIPKGVSSSVVAEKERRIRQLESEVQAARQKEEMFEHSKNYFDEMLKETNIKARRINELEARIRMAEVDAQAAKDLQEQLNDTLAEKYALERKIQDLVESPFIKNVEKESSTYRRLAELERQALDQEDELKRLRERLKVAEDVRNELSDQNRMFKSQNQKLSKRYEGMGIDMSEMAEILKKMDPAQFRIDGMEHLRFEGKTPEWVTMDMQERARPLNLTDNASLVRQIERLQNEKALLASELDKAQFLIREQIKIEDQLKDTHNNQVNQLHAHVDHVNREIKRNTEAKKALQEQIDELKVLLASGKGGFKFDPIRDGEVSVFSADTIQTVLGPQENLIDLLITTAEYDKAGLRRVLQEQDVAQMETQVSTFLSIDFFSHEPETTMLVAGLNPQFDVQISYKDKVDRFFIKEVKQNAVFITIDVFYPLPDKVVYLGKATIPLKNLVDQAKPGVSPALHANVPIFGTAANVTVGYLNYHLRFREPIYEALNDFINQQEFIEQHQAAAALTRAGQTDYLGDGNRVGVRLTVHRAVDLKRAGQSKNLSTFVAYTFYSKKTHFSSTLRGMSPNYEDTLTMELISDQGFRRYLATEKLKFMVFDDSRPLGRRGEDVGDLLGVAEIALKELTVGDRKIVQQQYAIILNNEHQGQLVITLELMDPRGADAARYYEGKRTSLSDEWRRLFLERLVHKIQEKELELEDTFRMFDLDRNQKVSADQFRNMLHKLKVPVKDPEIDAFLRESVTDREGLTLAQFSAMLEPIMNEVLSGEDARLLKQFRESCEHPRLDLYEAFKYNDLKQDGHIQETEFTTLLASKLDLSLSQIKKLWRNLSRGGSFAYEQWWRINVNERSKTPSLMEPSQMSRYNEPQKSLSTDLAQVAKTKFEQYLFEKDKRLDYFFQFSDKDRSGYLNLAEFKKTLLPLSDAHLSEAEIEALFASLDKDKSQRLTLGQMQLGLQSFNISHILNEIYKIVLHSQMTLYEVFQTYSGNGEYIKPDRLTTFISQMAHQLSPEEKTVFIKHFERIGQGRISMSAFISGFYKVIPLAQYELLPGDLVQRLNSCIGSSPYSLKSALSVYDSKDSGMISYFEFVAILNTMYAADLSRKERNCIRTFFNTISDNSVSLEIPQHKAREFFQLRPHSGITDQTAVHNAARILAGGLNKSKITVRNFVRPFERGLGQIPLYAFAALCVQFGKLTREEINTLAQYCNEGKNGAVRVRNLEILLSQYS